MLSGKKIYRKSGKRLGKVKKSHNLKVGVSKWWWCLEFNRAWNCVSVCEREKRKSANDVYWFGRKKTFTFKPL